MSKFGRKDCHCACQRNINLDCEEPPCRRKGTAFIEKKYIVAHTDSWIQKSMTAISVAEPISILIIAAFNEIPLK